MAAVGQVPELADREEAREALERDIPRVLGVPFEKSGWFRQDSLTILLPLWAASGEAAPDLFLLRLNFAYYPEWPASAQFVNPISRLYDPARDLCWLPRIEGNSRIQVHANYQPPVAQLICSSTTLEFYVVRHGVESRDLWDPKTQNFASTINAVKDGLRAPWYRGRMG